MRLFLAFDVPEGEKRKLENALQQIRTELVSARWIPRESWHLSLKFFGEVEDDKVEDLFDLAVASATAHAPFEARLVGAGAFPSTRRARVLWAGVEERPAGSIAALAADLESKAGQAGFRREARAHKPHLTIARLREPGAVVGEISSLVDFGGEWFVVNSMVLFRSHLSPRGAEYENLRSFPLG